LFHAVVAASNTRKICMYCSCNRSPSTAASPSNAWRRFATMHDTLLVVVGVVVTVAAGEPLRRDRLRPAA
jgi:hypothetical protein